ncbi:MAG: hypothetical protein QOJ85_3823 [Solirubrobacteraceae bacterium]|nr:hypothetical protein [Solirubrobacteraceae bacterium]
MTQRAAAALPRRALAGSAAGKAVEALTLAGLVALVPRALGPADYGAFAVALAVATGIATATGIGGPALFARVLAPLDAGARGSVARALVRRVAAARAALLTLLAGAAAAAALLAPGSVSALELGLAAAAVLGAGATLASQLALGLERTVAWSLRYPLENAVIVAGALVLYPLAGRDGALAAIALGAAAALALGLATAWPARRGGHATGVVPAGALRFARLQAAGGALTQAVHRGAAPAGALLGLTSAATGHAAIAAGAALAITYAVAQTTLVALPAATRAFPRDRAGAEAALRRVALACAVVVVPACALLALAAEPLLATTLGEEFREAAAPLRIALCAAALAPLWALATQLAALRDRPDASLAGAAAGAAAFAAIAVLAIPRSGASGAAAAMLAGVGATVAGTVAALRAGGAVRAGARA